MGEKIVVPIVNKNGLNSKIAEHFGTAPYFIVVNVDGNGRVTDQEIIANESEHLGGIGNPPDHILRFKPNAVITYGMGSKALDIFQAAKVAVLRTNTSTVKDVITAYHNKELEELTEGCQEAHHH